jgi:serine/threonine protein kinase/tetratricopeptide (TPR) repeat protein
MSRHHRLESLFLECVGLPPEQREALLDVRCAGDPDLKTEVLDLLGRDADPDTPTLPPFLAHPGTVPPPGGTSDLPVTIGPYRIVRRLGEGGFGEVFEAEQERPVRRRVALKVLKAGMDTRAVLARFAAERQALALMDHPGIAHVLDAGETESGRPYFAMELVAGEPITDWCDRSAADLVTRVELMIAVCRTVEHAHQKGVIHRDLKPTNILVTESDGRPVPKIIDFGIAKATLATADGESLHTRPEDFLGTPEYMSPEQATSGGMDVDTRTDVYSLGVVLYELLTDQLPFASERLRGLGLDEARRIVQHEEPPRPSAAGENTRSLRGDLDWITLRAMEKDRTRRYASPASMADDLARHLGEEPVLAGPPTLGYRLRKLARRRRGAVIGAAAVLVALAAGIAATAVQAIRATRAEDEARRQARAALAVNEFLTGMLASGNPESHPRGHELTMREVVERAAGELGDSTFADPAVEAGVREALAATFSGLGRYEEALPQAERALALTDPATGGATAFERSVLLARIQSARGDRAGAEVRLAALASRVPANDPERRANYLQARGANFMTMERLAEADSMLTESVALRRARFRADGSYGARLASSLTELSQVKGLRGMFPESEALAREALALTRDVHGDEHHDVANALGYLGSVMWRQGRYADAESLHLSAIAIDRRVLGPQHPALSHKMGSLGLVLSEQGRSREAEAAHREALAILTRAVPGEHHDLVTARNNLATAIQEQGRLDEALEMRLATLAMARRVHGPTATTTGIYLNNIGSLYRLQKRYAEAAPMFLAADSIFVANLGDIHPQAIIARYNLGKILLDQGRAAAAEPHLREAARRAATGLPYTHPNAAVLRSTLGATCFALGRHAEAESLLLGAHATLSAALGERHERTRFAAENLADLYRVLGRSSESQRWLAAAQAGTASDQERSAERR